MKRDKRRRTILKSFSFRILATITTMVLVFVFTGDFTIALSIGVIEFIAKLLLYYFHERVWEKVIWGKIKHEL